MTQGDVIRWSLVLIGLILLGFVAASLVKRRLSQQDPTPTGGFSLSDLRALHRGGKMSDEEFNKAKAAIVTAAQRATERELQEKKQAEARRAKPPT